MLSFEFAKDLFNFGVSRTSIASIYGTFAAIPFFLFWMYLVWVLVLCGAIVVHTMGLTPEQDSKSEPALVKGARVLEQLHGAHLEGRGLTDAELRAHVELNAAEHDRIFTALRDLRAVTQDDEDRWLLARSLKTLTLWDLYQRLPEGLDAKSLEAVEDMDHVVEPLRSLLTFGSNQMSVSLETVFGGST
jgi:membrane protein